MIHKVALRSAEPHGRRMPAVPVGRLLSHVPQVVRECVSMAFQRRSKMQGRPPAWLKAASDIRVLDIAGGDETVVRFDAPALGVAAPELYEQQELWPDRPDAQDTGFDLLGDVIDDVTRGNEDSERFDTQLLRSLAGFQRVLNASYQEMVISGHRYAPSAPAIVTKQTIATARDLQSKTPPPTRVRLVGVLDAVRISTQTFALKLDDGHEVRGVLSAGEFDGVLRLLTAQERVLVRGDALFRPSGQLLLIDAEDVESGVGESPIWSRLPQVAQGPLRVSSYRKRQTRTSGLAAVIGRWPGDETDEEIQEALEALR